MHGRSFDAWADHCDRYRPTFPGGLFELIASELALRSRPLVVDVGGATGRDSEHGRCDPGDGIHGLRRGCRVARRPAAFRGELSSLLVRDGHTGAAPLHDPHPDRLLDRDTDLMSSPVAVRVDRWTRLEELIPPYPTELFDHLELTFALPAAPDVVDFGAGTGRATIQMARRGWHVIALDSDAEALAGLRTRAAFAGRRVPTVVAAAEASTLPAASADLVTAAHAFHWFMARSALTEMARVTRRGGGLALFWDWRNADQSPLLAEHHALLRRFGVDSAQYLEARTAADAAEVQLGRTTAFDDVRRHEIDHTWRMSIDDYCELSLMPGFVHALTPTAHRAFAKGLAASARRHRDPTTATVTIPYRASALTARRSMR